MSIRLIVTDLDGTFYDDALQFDRDLFRSLCSKMKENDVEFAVASGNPFDQLISFFKKPEEFTFISNNGGKIVRHGKILFQAGIDPAVTEKVLRILEAMPPFVILILTGQNGSYVQEDVTESDYAFYRQFFPSLQKVPDLHAIQDPVISFALAVRPEEVDPVMKTLQKKIGTDLQVVHSGFGDIDLLIPGLNKGSALQRIMDLEHITADEVLAFGDAPNDLPMLELAGYGFVMKNADESMKQKIGRITRKTNQENGVLDIIQEYFTDPDAFENKYRKKNTAGLEE